MHQLQRALSLIYPDQCILCETRVEQQGGLCGSCWREMPFLEGLLCHSCGVSLPGSENGRVFCDDCLATPRLWEAGRAALSYKDAGKRIVLALKHADRLDLIPSCAGWMARAGSTYLDKDVVLVPIPAHWTRLLSRRYNQAVELARGVGHHTGYSVLPDGLVRTKRTRRQDGMSVEERMRNMLNAIEVNPKRKDRLAGQDVCIIDDVMTSGATLSSATNALYQAGVASVCVLVLARVEKAP